MSNVTHISPAATINSLAQSFSLAARQGVSEALQNMTAQEIRTAFSGKEDSAMTLAKAA